jgi:NAD(P)-dependent dehydrogenase (short-subunit alcohol dehydrogenase family)
MNDKNQTIAQDPVKQYSKMDIPRQSQPEPGLDAKMKPKADHGQSSYQGSGRLKGRKALITGADSGIGRAVAIAFAREGADVALSYLPEEQTDADETIRYIKEAGQKAAAIPGDLRDEDYCELLVEKTAEELGGLDILVNNAGKQVHVDDLEKLTTKQLKDTFTINIFAMFWITKAALKYLKPGSSIINTTSIQSYQPSAGLLDYASTKGAITAFTQALGKQLASKGIRVNAVAPGPIWTPLQPSHGQPQKKLTSFGQNTPLGRAGQPAEVAPAFVFLASQESSYITSEVIGVTGGNHLP